MITKYLSFIKIGFVITTLLLISYLYISKQNIIQENKILQETVLKEELRYSIVQEDLEVLNAEIEKQEEIYETWKNQKPKVKYKIVYKYKEIIKGGTCEEKVKSLGDIDFNSL